jgi:hypothetical protein
MRKSQSPQQTGAAMRTTKRDQMLTDDVVALVIVVNVSEFVVVSRCQHRPLIAYGQRAVFG